MSPEEFQQHIIDSVNNHPDIPDETKAAAVEKMREDLAEMDDKEAAAA
jgi:hypothetical protein